MQRPNYEEAEMIFRFSFLFRFFLLPSVVLFLSDPAILWAEVIHTVKPGESLYAIGKTYRLPAEEILKANQMNGETIRTGQKLVIPGIKGKGGSAKTAFQSGGGASGASKVPQTHKVKKGETLASIAKKYGLQTEDLKEINELSGQKLKTGKVIRLRWEEDAEEFGEGKNEPNQGAAEGREESLAFVQGTGFLLGEKSRELLGRAAKSFQGFRYTKGGGSINGMDCSSYVQRVYKIFGIDLPRTAREQFRVGYSVAKNALQVGDLVFFKRPKSREPTHVGIYLGDSQYIHTSLTKRQVDIDSLDGRYANLHFVGARRIEEIETQEPRREPEAEGGQPDRAPEFPLPFNAVSSGIPLLQSEADRVSFGY
jgi:cell wall-associated NlpC family hydrolase